MKWVDALGNEVLLDEAWIIKTTGGMFPCDCADVDCDECSMFGYCGELAFEVEE